jgi:hypothetical protein
MKIYAIGHNIPSALSLCPVDHGNDVDDDVEVADKNDHHISRPTTNGCFTFYFY